MSAKRKARDADGEEVDRVVMKRRALTLIQKVAILDRLAQGEGSTTVARNFGLSEGTVRSVKKCEDKIRSSVAAGAPHNAKMTFYARDAILQRMEKVLIEWIDDQNSKNIEIDGTIIRKEAKRLYDLYKSEEVKEDTKYEKVTTFVASKGWYEKFKKRVTLYNATPEEPAFTYLDQINNADNNVEIEDVNLFADNLKLKAEEGEATHLDYHEAEKFTSQLKKILDLKKYTPDQVFNAAETGLFWKKMPKQTFLSQEEENTPGSKFSNDKLNLLLCANASGKCTVKPMVVYRTLNPAALRRKSRYQLPVFWRVNPQTKITEDEFLDWFHSCFIPEVKLYMATKNIPFRVLLVLDTKLCHPLKLQDEDPNVKVVFLPQYTAKIIQPLHQGLIGLFRAMYTLRVFTRIVDAKIMNPFLCVSELWWDYNIAECLKIIKETLEAIRPPTINACWNILWKDAVIDVSHLPAVHHVVDKVVELGQAIGGEGFKDLESGDVEELLNSHDNELTPEEMEELGALSDDEVEDQGQILKNQLTLESLEKGFKLAKDLQDLLFEVDPFMERGFETKKGIEVALAPYKEMYNDLQYNKSLLINNAISRPDKKAKRTIISTSKKTDLPTKS